MIWPMEEVETGDVVLLSADVFHDKNDHNM